MFVYVISGHPTLAISVFMYVTYMAASHIDIFHGTLMFVSPQENNIHLIQVNITYFLCIQPESQTLLECTKWPVWSD